MQSQCRFARRRVFVFIFSGQSQVKADSGVVADRKSDAAKANIKGLVD